MAENNNKPQTFLGIPIQSYSWMEESRIALTNGKEMVVMETDSELTKDEVSALLNGSMIVKDDSCWSLAKGGGLVLEVSAEGSPVTIKTES